MIRLNLGDEHKQLRLIDADGVPVKLFIKPGETIIRPNVYYLGRIKVNLVGYWRKRLSKPLWIMTTLESERGLEIYLQLMKIEETFRDCKNLLHLTKLMNKKQPLLEQMIAFCLLAYVVGVWLGEAIRDVVYGKLDVTQVPNALLNKLPVDTKVHPKWLLYSGLFTLLKQKLRLSSEQVIAVSHAAADAFATLIYGNVRICVRTSVNLVDLNLLWLYTSHTGAISYGGDRHALSGLAVTFRFG